MKPFKFIVTLLLLFIVAYLPYMFWQASGVPKTIDLRSATNFNSIPATVCALSNDTDTISGTLYLFDNTARFDITSNANSQTTSVHLIVMHDEDTTYFWQDGLTSGVTRSYTSMYDFVGLAAITHVDCKPWWIINGDLFIPPQEVTFPKL